jgi:His/Glu/Gln/Arg/opine family amino acid ABC transporter permease subunit
LRPEIRSHELLLLLSTWLIALVLGTVLGIFRTAPNKLLAGFATCYVELFRNVPLLVQLFIWYFALPEILPFGDTIKSMSPLAQQFITAMLCLGSFTAARVCTGLELWPGNAVDHPATSIPKHAAAVTHSIDYFVSGYIPGVCKRIGRFLRTRVQHRRNQWTPY